MCIESTLESLNGIKKEEKDEELKPIKCKRCGRQLTNHKSIKRGYGKTCYRIIQYHKKEEKESLKEDRLKKLEQESTFQKCEIKKIKSLLRENKQRNNNKKYGKGDLELYINGLENRVKHLESKLKQVQKKGICNAKGIERIKKDAHRPERNENRISFNVVIKELKVFLEGDFKKKLKHIDVKEKEKKRKTTNTIKLNN